MKGKTMTAFREWKASTEYFIDCLSEEMGSALVTNDTNVLRSHMINIQILYKTKDVVSDWMNMERGVEDGNQ